MQRVALRMGVAEGMLHTIQPTTEQMLLESVAAVVAEGHPTEVHQQQIRPETPEMATADKFGLGGGTDVFLYFG